MCFNVFFVCDPQLQDSVGKSMSVSPVRSSSESVKVAVRVRPFSDREKEGSQVSIVTTSIPCRTVTLSSLDPNKDDTVFAFDSVFSSSDAMGGADVVTVSTQEDVYRELGHPLIEHAFAGYNSCLFTYGQTGSGKTYTMMGGQSPMDSGVVPRLTRSLFELKQTLESTDHCRWKVEIGFVEIYNEAVIDLLAGRRRDSKGKMMVSEDAALRVREHAQRGVFLEGQEFKPVSNPDEIAVWIERGNEARHVAATKMNQRSSRSHAIVQILLREERHLAGMPTSSTQTTIVTAGKHSRMNLVDLAGSERVSQSGVQGQQFAEATMINLSLTTLGRVIDVLAEQTRRSSDGRPLFHRTASGTTSVPPYRESKLTFILKDSLGGNCKTFMIAAVSPSTMNYEETLSTLRYASRAREIVNTVKINEDPKARRIRELEEEMDRMRSDLRVSGEDPAYVSELEEKLLLLESEAHKRAADLQALQLDREKSEMREKMLRATQDEKRTLQAKADELERQMTRTRADAEMYERQLATLREAQVKRESELLNAVKARDDEMSKLLALHESGQAQLTKTIHELDLVKQGKDEALRKLEAQRQELESLLATSGQSAEQRSALEQRNAELNLRIAQAEAENARNLQLLHDLDQVQEDRKWLEQINTILLLLLDEARARCRIESYSDRVLCDLVSSAFAESISPLGAELQRVKDDIAVLQHVAWTRQQSEAGLRLELEEAHTRLAVLSVEYQAMTELHQRQLSEATVELNATTLSLSRLKEVHAGLQLQHDVNVIRITFLRHLVDTRCDLSTIGPFDYPTTRKMLSQQL